MNFNEPGRRLLQSIMRDNHAAPAQVDAPTSTSPTLVKVSDPMTTVEELLAAATGDEMGGPPPNKWLARQSGRGLRRARGQVKLDMRACCVTLAGELDSRIHRIEIPSKHECPRCGTVWAVEMRVREERPHG